MVAFAPSLLAVPLAEPVWADAPASAPDVQRLSGSPDTSSAVHPNVSNPPYTVTLTGPTKDSSGNLDILVGQQCQATISLPPFVYGTMLTYQWKVSGTTFQSWTVVSDGNNQSHTTEVDGYGNSAAGSLSWYWNDKQSTSETVSCTVTATAPAGQTNTSNGGSGTKSVSVYLPGWNCTGNGGTMQINTLWGGGNGTDSCLYAGPIGDSGRGMEWKATVSAPTGCPALGVGVLEMVQTETPDTTYILTTGAGYKRSNNGQQGLDTSYPYGWQSAPPSPPSYEGGDSPGIDLTALSAASAQLQYQFVDTLMFEPPGSTQFVPLATLPWSTPASSTAPVNPSGVTNFSTSNTFPSWPQNDGYNWSYIPQ